MLLLRYCVAKRVRSKKRQALLKFLRQFQAGKLNLQLLKELRNAITWKYIALPVSPIYESWTIPLLKWIRNHGSLVFNLTRQRIAEIVKNSLKNLDPQVTTHSLRHWRLTHLVEHYDFDSWDLSIYAGWTFRTGLSRLGMPTGQTDTYLHLSWKRYFPKLLKPLS